MSLQDRRTYVQGDHTPSTTDYAKVRLALFLTVGMKLLEGVGLHFVCLVPHVLTPHLLARCSGSTPSDAIRLMWVESGCRLRYETVKSDAVDVSHAAKLVQIRRCSVASQTIRPCRATLIAKVALRANPPNDNSGHSHALPSPHLSPRPS